jgi:hypothetical protein
MIEAEFQVIRCVFGEHRLARLERLPQQYAIDVGKQNQQITLRDGDAAARDGKTIVTSPLAVKRLVAARFTGITHVSGHDWKGT